MIVNINSRNLKPSQAISLINNLYISILCKSSTYKAYQSIIHSTIHSRLTFNWIPHKHCQIRMVSSLFHHNPERLVQNKLFQVLEYWHAPVHHYHCLVLDLRT